MSEEKNKDWKEVRIAEYARLEARKHAWEKNIGETTFLKNLRTELENARIKLDEAETPYNEKLDAITQQQAGIKLELAENWDIEEKTFKCNVGTATLKTTRSLHIRSKEKLVEFLALNKKLVEFIKSFETGKLRKLKDAGMIEEDVVTWDEKRGIAIQIAEVKG